MGKKSKIMMKRRAPAAALSESEAEANGVSEEVEVLPTDEPAPEEPVPEEPPTEEPAPEELYMEGSVIEEPVVEEPVEEEPDVEEVYIVYECPYLAPPKSISIGPSGKKFYVHPGILAQAPVLETQAQMYNGFGGGWKALPDIKPSVFELVLHHLYGRDYQTYYSLDNPKSGKGEALANALERHGMLYCFALRFEMDELAALTKERIISMGPVPFRQVFNAAREAYHALPDHDTWFRGHFRAQLDKALEDEPAIIHESWVMDHIREGAGSFSVDLFTGLLQHNERLMQKLDELKPATENADEVHSGVDSTPTKPEEESQGGLEDSPGRDTRTLSTESNTGLTAAMPEEASCDPEALSPNSESHDDSWTDTKLCEDAIAVNEHGAEEVVAEEPMPVEEAPAEESYPTEAVATDDLIEVADAVESPARGESVAEPSLWHPDNPTEELAAASEPDPVAEESFDSWVFGFMPKDKKSKKKRGPLLEWESQAVEDMEIPEHPPTDHIPSPVEVSRQNPPPDLDLSKAEEKVPEPIPEPSIDDWFGGAPKKANKKKGRKVRATPFLFEEAEGKETLREAQVPGPDEFSVPPPEPECAPPAFEYVPSPPTEDTAVIVDDEPVQESKELDDKPCRRRSFHLAKKSRFLECEICLTELVLTAQGLNAKTGSGRAYGIFG